jgi:hypothetical protein
MQININEKRFFASSIRVDDVISVSLKRLRWPIHNHYIISS